MDILILQRNREQSWIFWPKFMITSALLERIFQVNPITSYIGRFKKKKKQIHNNSFWTWNIFWNEKKKFFFLVKSVQLKVIVSSNCTVSGFFCKSIVNNCWSLGLHGGEPEWVVHFFYRNHVRSHHGPAHILPNMFQDLHHSFCSKAQDSGYRDVMTAKMKMLMRAKMLSN